MLTPESPAASPTLFRKKAGPFVTAARLGGGGEGQIFEIGGEPTHVVKLYRRPDVVKRRKLEAMLRAIPEDPQLTRNHVSICWPDDVVLDDSGRFIGFAMPRLDLGTHRPVALFWNPEDRAETFPAFTWKYLCVAAANIASLVDLVHRKGHIVGDLNEENMLVNDRALASMVDCDSMQIRDPETGEAFGSSVSREPYISPEAIGKALDTYERTQHDDEWALAVLLFQVLMEGQHPADGIGDPEARIQRVLQGYFPALGEPGFSLAPIAAPFDLLPESTQSLFVRCFRDGHREPSKRPTAAEWRNDLHKLASSLVQCATEPLHWYSSHRAACPWCEQKKSVGIDRFKMPAATQTPLPRVSVAAPPATSIAAGTTGVTGRRLAGIGAAFGLVLLLAMLAHDRPSSTTRVERPSNPQIGGSPSTNSREAAPPPKRGSQAEPPPPPSQQTSPPSPEPPRPSFTAPPTIADNTQWFRHSSPAFVVNYPAGWTVNGSNDSSVFIDVPSARRGAEWSDYGVRIEVLPASASRLVDTTRTLIQGMNHPPSRTQTGQSAVTQTKWGEAMWTTFDTPTRYDYIEHLEMWTIARPAAVVIVSLEAPKPLFDRTRTTFDRILGSLDFPVQRAVPQMPLRRHVDRFFALSYPNGWSVNGASPGRAFLCESRAIRRTPSGDLWCDYGVKVLYWPGSTRPDLTDATRGLVDSLVKQEGKRVVGQSQAFQSSSGSALWTTLVAPTPFDYIQETQLLTLIRPTGLAAVLVEGPRDQMTALKPTFDILLNSLTFAD